MLVTAPSTASAALVAIWNLLKTLTVERLTVFWARVETGQAPVIDVKNAFYTEWVDDGDRYYGMRHQSTKKLHGIIREVTKTSVQEATYKDGKIHGLHRSIRANKIQISLYREGKLLGQFAFKPNFEEISRKDKESVLSDLAPEHFKL